MGINVGETLMGLVTTSGIYQYLTNPLALIMVAIACVLLYLAIVKQFEPLLLLPIAFGMLLTNLLGSDIFHEELFAGGHANWALFGGAVLIDGKDFVDSVGYMVNAAGQILTSNNVVLGHFVNAVTIDDPTKLVPFADILAQFAANGNAASIILEDAFLKNGAVYTATGAMLATAGKTISAGLLDYLYLGVKLGIYPCLIFMGVGAGTDFGPLISNPKTLLLGAAAQLGIFMTFIFAYAVFGFSAAEAGAIGIIGGADGPTAIFLASKLAAHLLAPIAVAAYSYMALIPIIQPPIMKLLTTKKERSVEMKQLRTVSKTEKIIFPVVVLVICAFMLPSVAPLIGMFMLGNLFRESGVVERLSDTAQNALTNIVTILLGVTVGATANGQTFLSKQTIFIIILGLTAFCFSTAGGVLLGKLMYLVTKGKVNPLIGSAGVSAVPMAARVSQVEGRKANPTNFLLMHAMGPNVAGVIGSAVAAGFLLLLFGK
mgnify:FL=1